MIGKVLALLAVPVGIVAYSSLAKATPKTGPSFNVKGKSGTNWAVVRVSQFQNPGGLLTMNDVTAGGQRVMRYSQLGSALSTRKYITSPFDAGQATSSAAGQLLRRASADFGVVLPSALNARLTQAGA